MNKVCSKCKMEKDLSEFYASKRSKDRKQSECKECHYANEKKQHKKDPELWNRRREERKQREPWAVTLMNIGKRCGKLRYYKHVENHLTIECLKLLWERDSARDMECAAIHRKDSNEHYTYDNCEYMEFTEHSRLHLKPLNAGGGKR